MVKILLWWDILKEKNLKVNSISQFDPFSKSCTNDLLMVTVAMRQLPNSTTFGKKNNIPYIRNTNCIKYI